MLALVCGSITVGLSPNLLAEIAALNKHQPTPKPMPAATAAILPSLSQLLQSQASGIPTLSSIKKAQHIHAQCEVSDWGGWSKCYSVSGKSCGGRMVRSRTRSVMHSAAESGRACPPLTKTQSCPPQPCCTFGRWGAWSPCVFTCQEVHAPHNEQTRVRRVTGGAAACGAAGAAGARATRQTRVCRQDPCPVPCVLSGWVVGMSSA